MPPTHTHCAYPWQTDWNEYSHIARSLFQHLRSQTPTPPPLLSFLACDAVSHLQQTHCETRGEALKLGQCLVEDGIISHVGRMRPFEDSARVFRFNVPTGDEIAYRIGLTRFPVVHGEEWDEFQGECGSHLAFSEASCEMMDDDLMRNERQGVVEPEALRQIPVSGVMPERGGYDGGYKCWNDGDCGAGLQREGELEEPKVAYKVLSCFAFGSDGGRARVKEESGGCMTSAFSHVPAFREKLSNALMARSFVGSKGGGKGREESGETASSDGGGKRGRGMWARSWKRSKAVT